MESGLPDKCQNILFNLKTALIKYKVSLDELIKKIFGMPKQYLVSKQFEKVIKFGDLKLTFQQIDVLFAKLEENGRVQVVLINKLLSTVVEQSRSVDVSISSWNDIKILGMKEVKNYLKQNGPYEAFDLFDNDKDGHLDITELNNLFINASQILSKNKQQRVAIIRFFLQKLPYNMINISKLLTIFGLEQQPKRVVLNQPLDMMKSRLDTDLKRMYMTKQAKKQTKQINTTLNKPIIEKKPEISEPVSLPQKQYFNLTHALKYYRLEYKYVQIMELVQYYLSGKQVFIDTQNPKTTKGQFVEASKIFKGKFNLIEVAQSVIEREKARKGLGLQFEAKDIIQGSVGNCYLLSSLSSVVDRFPEFVSNYFLFNTNPSGIYVVRLFNDGQWSNIVLDDRFPCNGIRPIYAKPHGNQIWVMLLQKAWAKLHGSYENIDLGSSLEAFVALTGAPCKYMRSDEQKQSDIKSLILDGFSKNGMITCSGSPKLNKMPKQESEKIGLIGNHAYSLLNLYVVVDPETKQRVQIVRIRNPWGNLEWKGDWSFNSSKWSPQLRQKYNYTKNPNDGSFYIDWNNFSIYFSSITVCYMNPQFVNSSFKLTVDRHQPSYIKFKINKTGKYIFTVYQQSKRKYQHKQTYQISESSLTILKSSQANFQFIKSGSKSQSNLSVQEQLKEGVYIAKLYVKWNYFNSHQCVLTSYGPENVIFQSISGSDIQPKFTSDMINGFSNKYLGEVSNYSKIGIPESSRQVFFSIEYGLGYIKIKNPSKKQFTTTIALKQSEGLKLLDIFQMPMKAIMKSDTQQLYGFLVSAKGFRYSLQEHLQFTK